MKNFPQTASSRDVQRNYRALFDTVLDDRKPLVILNRNKPEVVIIDIKTYMDLTQAAEEHEQESARKAVDVYQREKKQKKLKKLRSLADLA